MAITCKSCETQLSRRNTYVTEYKVRKMEYYPSVAYCKECYYEQLECTGCSKKLDKDTCKFAFYSLKRGARIPPIPYCEECYKVYLTENEGDFCKYCGDNSFGTSPCSTCRRRY